MLYRTSKQTWLYEYDESMLFNSSRVRSSIGHYMREGDIRHEEDGVDRCGTLSANTKENLKERETGSTHT